MNAEENQVEKTLENTLSERAEYGTLVTKYNIFGYLTAEEASRYSILQKKLRYENEQISLETTDSSNDIPEHSYVAGQDITSPKQEIQQIPVDENATLVDGVLDGEEADTLVSDKPITEATEEIVTHEVILDNKGELTSRLIPNKSLKEGLRFNEGKVDYTLLDLTAFTPMIEVLEFGAKKYSRNNWKNGGDQFTLLKILGSTMRHLAQLLTGELYDKESGLSHIGHMQCNLMFIGYFWNEHLAKKKSKKKSKFLDDLYK